MRYLSSIIKSEKVSIGKTVAVELDLPKVIKNPKPTENNKVTNSINKENESGNVKNMEQQIPQTNIEPIISDEEKEAILAKYMEEARKKSELFFENEMKKAYDEGLKKAENDSQNIINEAKNKANEIILEASEIKKKAVEEYKQALVTIEPEVVALSMDIAMKILNKEIEHDNEYILNIVKDAMDRISTKKDIILKVSEKDYTIIIGNMDIMLAKVEGFSDVTVVKEPSLSDGSCIVETEYGIIDGSMQTRTEQIRNEIEKMLNR